MVTGRRTRSATLTSRTSDEFRQSSEHRSVSPTCESKPLLCKSQFPVAAAPVPRKQGQAVAKAAPCSLGGTQVYDLWAWRYGRDREWRSVRDCQLTVGPKAIRVTKDGRLLQEVDFSLIQDIMHYTTSGRAIVSSRSGNALFLSFEKSWHQKFLKGTKRLPFPSRSMAYGEFFAQQKAMTFPDEPAEGAHDDNASSSGVSDSTVGTVPQQHTPTQPAAASPEGQLLLSLQKQLQDLQVRNEKLSVAVSHIGAPAQPVGQMQGYAQQYPTQQYTNAVPQPAQHQQVYTQQPYAQPQWQYQQQAAPMFTPTQGAGGELPGAVARGYPAMPAQMGQGHMSTMPQVQMQPYRQV